MREIVLVIDKLKLYGAERVCLDLAEQFSKTHPTTIITYGGPEGDTVAPPAGVRRIRIRRCRVKLVAFLQAVVKLHGHLSARPEAAVVSFMPLANVMTLIASLRTGNRIVVTEHNLPSEAFAEPTARTRVLIALMRLLYRRAHAVVAVSDSVRADVMRLIGDQSVDHVKTIHNPVSLDRLRSQLAADPSPPSRLTALRLTDERMTIITVVAALKRAKGQDVALRALSQLPLWCHMLFIGGGPEEARLKCLAQELGVSERTHLVGPVLDVARWMVASDLVLVPSRYEGFGLVAVEAAGLGCNVLLAASPGLSEIGQIVGCHATTLTASDMAAAIVTAIGRPPLERPPGLYQFDPGVVADRYLSVLFEG